MTVKQLKEALETLPDSMEVILQKDSEGNGYSPLAVTDAYGIYIPDSTYSGEVYDSNWTADEADMDEYEWNETKEKPRSLILYPTN